MTLPIILSFFAGSVVGILIMARVNSWAMADRDEEIDDLREMLDDVEQQYKLATEAALQARRANSGVRI